MDRQPTDDCYFCILYIQKADLRSVLKSLTIIQYKINRTYKKLRRSPMDRLQGLEPCPANMQDSRPFRINTVKLNHKDPNMHILPDYMQI